MLLFFWRSKFTPWTSKRCWKLIVLCNITLLCLPSPFLFPLLFILLSITWSLGKVLILHPADWLAAMLSHLLTLCQTLIICSRLPPPKHTHTHAQLLLKARNCCRCSLLERLPFISMKVYETRCVANCVCTYVSVSACIGRLCVW